MQQTPQAVKYNNRYRGPQESEKVNMFYAQAKYNINKLDEIFNKLDIKKEEIKLKPKNIESLTVATSTFINSIDITFEKILNSEVK